MQKLKTYGSLFMAMFSCFNLGLYASSTFRYHESIEPHRWIITSMFGLMFLGLFFVEYRKNHSYVK
jgi:hypothetical protein